uniref:G-protein coupled receptors family 1 profile domain-containing protein n=1 Tax=Plectus sambesii TaxID=2011161 RepID=A0A914WQ90_9BILA
MIMDVGTQNATVLSSALADPRTTIRKAYPPVEEPQERVMVVVFVFIVCFVVGIGGNACLLTTLRGFTNQTRRKHSSSGARGWSNDSAVVYIGALCVVDFITLLSLPPVIVDSVVGFWLFGTALCKLHHLCGSVGRILSTLIIATMSFDRYAAVCRPHVNALRSKRTALTMVVGLSLFALLLLLPMLVHAEAHEVLLEQIFDSKANVLTQIRVYKCSDLMPMNSFYWFTISTFLLGYLAPLVVIVGFNATIMLKLFVHKRHVPSSSIPLRRITVYTAAIALFHFVCWTPYWIGVLYAVCGDFFHTKDMDEGVGDAILFVMYCLHLLPYINCASNWILYGLLNSQLKQRTNVHE